MMKEDIRPSKILYAVAALILVAGIALFVNFLVTGITSSMEAIDHQVVVPGSSILELNETGRYTIYFETKSVIGGKIYNVKDVHGLSCSLMNVKTGEYIDLTSSVVKSNYSLKDRKGSSMYDFVLDKAGQYELKGWYESGGDGEAVLAVGKGFFKKLMGGLLLSMGSLFLGLGASIGLFVFTLIKRQRNKARML